MYNIGLEIAAIAKDAFVCIGALQVREDDLMASISELRRNYL